MRIDITGLLDGFAGFDPLALGIAPGTCLIVDFTGPIGQRLANLPPAAEQWLASLPCPSIALTESIAGVGGFDMSLNEEAHVQRIEAAVAANPTASTILVQTLRLVERLPLLEGLTVESLAFAALQQADEFHAWLKSSRERESTAPAGDSGPPVVVTRSDDVLSILLNRPATRNAVDVVMRDALFEAYSLAVHDHDLRRVDVRGAGDSFCTGGALGDFGRIGSGAAGHMVRTERLPARMLARAGEKFHFHLHGACIGAGIEMAAFGGRVTASPDAFIRLPEVGMGLIPGAGGTVSITRRIGRQAAAWIMLTGQRISARTALRLGLIDEIVREPAAA